MPYRKLPNSVIKRLRSMKDAKDKYDATTTVTDRAISADMYNQLLANITSLQAASGITDADIAVRSSDSSTEDAAEHTLQITISHFLQSFNFGVHRGIFKESDRAYYKLPVNQEHLPNLHTEGALKTWSDNIVNGEAARMGAGGNPPPVAMVMPSADEVSLAAAAFTSLSSSQSVTTSKKEIDATAVNNLLPGIDNFILDLWDTIEYFYRKTPKTTRRTLCAEWGVVYLSRHTTAPAPPPAGTPPNNP